MSVNKTEQSPLKYSFLLQAPELFWVLLQIMIGMATRWAALKLLKFCFSICQHQVANKIGLCNPDLHLIPKVIHGMFQSPMQNPRYTDTKIY